MARSGWVWPTTAVALASTVSGVFAMALTLAYTVLAYQYLVYPRINCDTRVAPLWFDFVRAGFLAVLATIVYGSTFGIARLLRVDRTTSLRLVSVVLVPVVIGGWFLLKYLDATTMDWNCSD
jgi:hypothetical protein